MSAMISALTHIVSGDVPVTNGADNNIHYNASEGSFDFTQNINMSSSTTTTQSLSSSSNYVTSSSFKRTRDEDDRSFGDQFLLQGGYSPALPTTSKPFSSSSQPSTNFYDSFQFLGIPSTRNVFDDNAVLTSTMASHLQSSSSSSAASSSMQADTSISPFYNSIPLPPWSASDHSSSSSR
ncbi:hypothetical protein TSUD_319100 [Trifolium subterraneum]|uniref:Uncharacterized protein n=1 Tax=Trifolium subterraneum TaxID=3900 RepID=A0A2Z6MZS1_TRISU|nr:hypothetical protein TSUD_319100 [Trifolium subterraneum]